MYGALFLSLIKVVRIVTKINKTENSGPKRNIHECTLERLNFKNQSIPIFTSPGSSHFSSSLQRKNE